MIEVTIDLKSVYGEKATLSDLGQYDREVLEKAGEGNVVTLTGQAPVWL